MRKLKTIARFACLLMSVVCVAVAFVLFLVSAPLWLLSIALLSLVGAVLAGAASLITTTEDDEPLDRML